MLLRGLELVATKRRDAGLDAACANGNEQQSNKGAGVVWRVARHAWDRGEGHDCVSDTVHQTQDQDCFVLAQARVSKDAAKYRRQVRQQDEQVIQHCGSTV